MRTRSRRAGVAITTFALVSAIGAVVPVEARSDAAIGQSRRFCIPVATGTPGDLAVVNITPVAATDPGSAQLVSSDVAVPPVASNVNFSTGSVDPNVAVAPVGTDGSVCFVNSVHAQVQLIVDLLTVVDAGAYTPTTAPNGAPVRLADTRIGLAGTRLTPGERRCFEAPGNPGDTAVVNLTPVGADGSGNGVLVSSDTTTSPSASSVNFGPGSVDPNLGVAAIGADGTLCFHNSDNAAVDLVADLLVTLNASTVVPTSTGAPVKARRHTHRSRRNPIRCRRDALLRHRCHAWRYGCGQPHPRQCQRAGIRIARCVGDDQRLADQQRQLRPRHRRSERHLHPDRR
jgi:hypothetical protein